MELNTLNPGKAAKGKSRKRIGRGPGSGWGTTAGEAWLQVSLRQGHADR